MTVRTLNYVNESEFFHALRRRFPQSHAETEFCRGSLEDDIRLFFTPYNEEDEMINSRGWYAEMLQTFKEELGVGYNEVIGVKMD